MKPLTQTAHVEPSIRILKAATCPSLSGRSKLSYEIGCKNGSEIQLRIVTNSASGSFNREWIDVQAIRSVFERAPRGATITSDALRPLFKGKSVNNQLFLFAVLMNEGLVNPSDKSKRGYERAESIEFMRWQQTLINGKGTPSATESKNKTAKPKSATPSKRPTASRKK
jgi:hypothetical protein